MADGSSRNIQDVKIGEIVLGGDGEINTVKDIHMPVLGDRRDRKLYSFNGGPFFVTAEHPFKTIDGWKAMDPLWAMEEHSMRLVNTLTVGDTLITKNGEVLLKTIDVKDGEANTQLYNLKLGGDHTYYTDGYLVHNVKCEPGAGMCGDDYNTLNTKCYQCSLATNFERVDCPTGCYWDPALSASKNCFTDSSKTLHCHRC